MPNTTELATLGGGCYWCLEACFEKLIGVEKCVSGFAGGAVPNPSYRAVCNGTTGHAEVVQLTFDPSVRTFAELLEVFFAIHDPTTLNRQGADVGTQYRSVIFHHTPEQKRVAEECIARLTAERVWDQPVVTEVVPFERFYPAEEYHQGYYRANPEQPYCLAVVAPKVRKTRQKFTAWLKS
jgi:peptide-methionine (S)-S-oxide reductase